jgi:hypothetical protein
MTSYKGARRTAAMEGGGFYNKNSAMQAAGISALLPLWERLIADVELDGGPLVIADYGSSQGRNSLAPIAIAIDRLRARTRPEMPIEVVHTDLPSNDYSALFETIQSDPASYLRANVFPSAIGRSYFDPIIPPDRVHLGWNSWTMQWLGAVTINAPDQFFPSFSKSEDVITALRQVQAADWRRFLEARSIELKRGARMLTGFPGRTSEGSGWEWLAQEIWGVIVDLGREGVLSEDEQFRLTVPTAPRLLDDIYEPFRDGVFSGLEIVSAGLIQVADPVWDAFERSGDATALASSHANMMRAFSGPTVSEVLADRQDREVVVNEIYERLALRLALSARPHQPYLAAVGLRKL